MNALDENIASNAPEHPPTMPSLYSNHDDAATARSPSDQDEAIPKHCDDDNDTESTTGITFFRLPREIRDQIYHRCLPNLAAIHVNHAPSMAVQPAISKVCRQMRQEFLELFYKRMKFLVAYRPGNVISHLSPYNMAPVLVLERWITAIGDENVKMIRFLSFNRGSFTVNVRIAIAENNAQSLVFKFRLHSHQYSVASNSDSSNNIFMAAKRAERALQRVIDGLQAGVANVGLSAYSVKEIGSAIESIQPFLCVYYWEHGLGRCELPNDTPSSSWPSMEHHSKDCSLCSGCRGAKKRFSSV